MIKFLELIKTHYRTIPALEGGESFEFYCEDFKIETDNTRCSSCDSKQTIRNYQRLTYDGEHIFWKELDSYKYYIDIAEVEAEYRYFMREKKLKRILG